MLSVIIPIYNEEEILENSVLRLHAYLLQRGLDHEILVTSNGSTDGSAEIGKRLAAAHSWFRFFHLPVRSVGNAFRNGVEQARGEFVVSLDADLPTEFAFLDYAVELLKHADMLVGSKTMGRQHRSPVRVLGSQLYILMTLLLFDLTISDYSIGAKAFRREAILPVLKHLDSWTGYIFELCLYLHNQKKKVVQVGIDCNDNRSSHFSLLHEGFYRYKHLFQCWRKMRDKTSWLYRPLAER